MHCFSLQTQLICFFQQVKEKRSINQSSLCQIRAINMFSIKHGMDTPKSKHTNTMISKVKTRKLVIESPTTLSRLLHYTNSHSPTTLSRLLHYTNLHTPGKPTFSCQFSSNRIRCFGITPNFPDREKTRVQISVATNRQNTSLGFLLVVYPLTTFPSAEAG